MITIVTMAWGKWPAKYQLVSGILQRRYFKNFREALKRYSTVEFHHVHYTDRPATFDNNYTRGQKNLIVKPLDGIAKWRGCMPKLEAFKNDPDLRGQVFVFDLDNVFVGNIDGLLSYRGDFAICWDPLPARRHLIGGNISSFPAGSLEHLHRIVAADYEKYVGICKGSERFLLDHMLATGELKSCEFLQDLYPGQIRSLKFELNFSPVPPPEMTILWLHGKPRPHFLKKKGYAEYQKLWEGKSVR